LTAAALASGIDRFGLVQAFAQSSSYKALVCIFLGGGNDGNNTVVPLDGYAAYASVRQASTLALAENSLLPITPKSLGQTFGFHPSLSALQPLFAEGKLAIVTNVGPLIQPLSKQDYLGGAQRPYQLFSHSDQIAQWQTSLSTGVSPTGWGGRVADTFPINASGYPVITALAGGVFTRGLTSPLTVADARTPLNALLALSGFTSAADDQARLSALNSIRAMDGGSLLAASANNINQQAAKLASDFTADLVLSTTFPNTTLGNQLKQVAKLIKFNFNSGAPALARQIYFCSLGGFDTHQNQLATQVSLLTQVGDAMKAFYDATVELQVDSQVVAFTLSDFGRTFQPSGSGTIVGTDHAWGNHHFVVGSSVVGGDFYGVPGPLGDVFPSLQLNGPDDTDTGSNARGRWIPSTSVDQYAATLARWFGVDETNIDNIFPQLRNFSIRDLRFLA